MTSKEQIVIYNKIRYLAMKRLKNEFYYEYRKFYKEEAEKLQAIEKELK